MERCAWCKKIVNEVYEVEDLSDTYKVCIECKRKNELHICRQCGKVINESISINGRCLRCSQVIMAKAEKDRKIIQEGLGVDLYEKAMRASGRVMSEEEYCSWLTFAPLIEPTKETKLFTRKTWLKLDLCGSGAWTEKEFDDNIDDITVLVEKRPKEIFLENKKLVLMKPGVKLASVVIDRSGKVYLLDEVTRR